MKIKWNENALNELQDRVNRELQAAVRRVRDQYEGESVDEVFASLVRELHQVFGGDLAVDAMKLRGVAQEIVEGTLVD